MNFAREIECAYLADAFNRLDALPRAA